MAARRHLGWTITRSIYHPGDYTARRGDEVLTFPFHWGVAGVKSDLDRRAHIEQEAERERARVEAAEERRRALQLERDRLWLHDLPHTTCPKCRRKVVDALTEAGQRIPLDVEINPGGDWAAVACRVAGRVPIVRRTGEPIADRYDVHSSVCPARPAMAEPSGQLRLRFRGSLIDRQPRPAKAKPNRQMFLTLSHRAEQLSLGGKTEQ
jgi:hypothetical protein